MVIATAKPQKSAAKPREDVKRTDATFTFPVRALNVVGAASKYATRYSFNAVNIAASDKGVTLAATDGRRAVQAFTTAGASTAVASVLVPGEIALSALKIADRASSSNREPMATVTTKGDQGEIAVSSGPSTAVLAWNLSACEGEFPPIDSVIPAIAAKAAPVVGINPDLLSSTINVVSRIVGKGKTIRWRGPEEASRPMAFDVTSDSLTITAVIMPMRLPTEGVANV